MHTTRRTAVPSRSAAHAALIALLAIALLTAAAAGLRHRITHNWPAMAEAAQDAARNRPHVPAPDPAAVHSCLAYDAAAQAEHLPSAPHAARQPATPAPVRACARPLPRALSAPAHRLARGPPVPACPD
jgi:hypothetical protein